MQLANKLRSEEKKNRKATDIRFLHIRCVIFFFHYHLTEEDDKPKENYNPHFFPLSRFTFKLS